MGTRCSKMDKSPKRDATSATLISSIPQSTDATVTITSPQTFVLPDGVTIIWLDSRATFNSNDGYATKVMLDRIHSSVLTVDNVNDCRGFLNSTDNKNSRIFLIVSGKFSAHILPDLKTSSTIDSVFIYCGHWETYDHLVNKYSPHVIGVFTERKILQSCLQIELNNYTMRAPVYYFFAQKKTATRDLTYEAASFIWFQLLQKILMETRFDQNDKNEMLDYCRQHYLRRNEQQKMFSDINEFQTTYTPTDAIRWYTRQTFVYELINKALRTEDIDALYVFRFYIADLCRRLANEHSEVCRQSQESPLLTLYRGCPMTLQELNRLQDTIGGMTIMNGFVSTSKQRWVAEMFLSHNSHHEINMQKVLWIIEADCRMNDVIFASVAQYSQHPIEEEVLFNIGSAFRIDVVEFKEVENIWYVKATSTDAGLHVVSEYMKLIERELNETSKEVILGMLLIQSGKYLTAQGYLQNLIRRTEKDHPHLAAFHYNLGLTYTFQREINLAESNFLQALEYLKGFPLRQRDEVRTLNALGWVFQDNAELPEALEYYNKAASICNEKLGSDDLANVQTYTYMGRYFLVTKQFKKSKTYYERALEILRLHSLIKHQHFGVILTEIGDVWRKQNDHDQALKLYQQAEAIFRDILPQHHPCMAYCWSRMGFVFLQLNDIEVARRYHKKALKSYKLFLPPDHINIKTSEANLKCINYNMTVDSYLRVCSQL